MNDDPVGLEWSYHRFGLLVTGQAEAEFMPSFLRALASAGDCGFQVIRRIQQRSPRTSEKKRLSVVGTDKRIPSLDMQEIGLPARNFLAREPNSFVILIDDLEHARRGIGKEIFERYSDALDSVIPGDQRRRASVHFLANMLEAYYFAHADAINRALGSNIEDHTGDVEEIRNPKGQLRTIKPDFHEIADGKRIVAFLDLEHVLRNPDTCAFLRTLFKWCIAARRLDMTDRFQALSGACSTVTAAQLDSLTIEQ